MGSIIYHRRFPNGHMEVLDTPEKYALTSPPTYTDTILHKYNTDSSFYIFSMGHKVTRPGYRIAKRAFDRFMVIYVTDGYCFVNGTIINARQGRYIYPMEYHTIETPSNRTCEYYWYTLKGTKTNEHIQTAGFDSMPVVFDCDWIEKIVPVIRDAIYNPHNDTDIEYYLLGCFNIIASYHRFATQSHRRSSSYKFDHIEKAIKYIKENYTTQIRVTDIANELYTSVNYLDNIFKEKLGVSPYAYITELRMSLAKSLLLDRKQSITQISCAVGYGDYTQFSTAFKKRYGLSPNKYRKEIANKHVFDEE